MEHNPKLFGITNFCHNPAANPFLQLVNKNLNYFELRTSATTLVNNIVKLRCYMHEYLFVEKKIWAAMPRIFYEFWRVFIKFIKQGWGAAATILIKNNKATGDDR